MLGRPEKRLPGTGHISRRAPGRARAEKQPALIGHGGIEPGRLQGAVVQTSRLLIAQRGHRLLSGPLRVGDRLSRGTSRGRLEVMERHRRQLDVVTAGKSGFERVTDPLMEPDPGSHADVVVHDGAQQRMRPCIPAAAGGHDHAGANGLVHDPEQLHPVQAKHAGHDIDAEHLAGHSRHGQRPPAGIIQVVQLETEDHANARRDRQLLPRRDPVKTALPMQPVCQLGHKQRVAPSRAPQRRAHPGRRQGSGDLPDQMANIASGEAMKPHDRCVPDQFRHQR